MHPPLLPRQERYFLLTLAGIQFSHILDFMIMMPLGPFLMQDLGISTHQFGLLVASYSFSAAASGLLAATFIDRFERKRFLLIVFALFGLATLACGLANDYAALLIARGLAGTFGGIMGAMVQTMVGDVIPYARRAKAGGTIAAAFSMSTVAGVPLSLWLASHLQWRAPFILIFLLTLAFLAVGLRALPLIDHHLHQAKRAHPFSAMFEVLRNANHLRALLFSALIIFSGFTIIPYITLYAVGNAGIATDDIPLIYLFGGAATLFSARLIGQWADLRGKVTVYRIVALSATVPLILITHIGLTSLWVWLLCTTAFFVLVSGRMIPAMAIITSAAQPQLRGTFMSLHATVQSLAMGLATTLAGFIIHQGADGSIMDYPQVGYVAVTANLIAIGFVARVIILDRPAGAPH